MESSKLRSTNFPKRGSRVCNYCGCSSGNRSYACKSCHRPFPQKESVEAPEKGTKRASCDVSDLMPHEVPMPKKLYSVRTRDRGPDYRTLVSVSEDGLWKCHYDACKTVQESRMRSTTCSDIQRNAFSGECEHVRKVQKESPLQQSLYHPLHVNTSILQSLPFPPSVKDELQAMGEEFSTGLIQRVSEETFLVRDVKRTQEHQFGVLHMRFPKPKLQKAGGPAAPPTFYCPCATFRRFSSLTSHSGGGTTPRLSKRCIHFYVCLWAFASNKNLAREFSCYICPGYAGTTIFLIRII